MPLELQSAAGLVLLGLLAPLVLLYVLKVKRRPQRVASIWLWASAERDLLAKHPFRRLMPQVPLVLEALALVLLAVAVARPATRGGSLPGDHVAIVLDASASMTAASAGAGTRMAEARQAALDVISALGPGADAMVIEAGHAPLVTSPLDRDRQRLKTAVARSEALEVEGNLTQALALAGDRLRLLPGSKRIVVITDGSVAERVLPGGTSVPLDILTVGEPVDNAALVRVDIRRGRDPVTRRDQVQAFALVANHGTLSRDLFVTLRLRNASEPLASRRLLLGPGERTPVVLTFEPEPGDLGSGVVLELSPPDALPVDDRAFARIPPGRRMPVVMAPADGNVWVRRALEADPEVELLGVPVGSLANAGVPHDALVVVSGACPEVLPGSDVLLLNPPPGPCRGTTIGAEIDRPILTSWLTSDPRLRFLTLDGIAIARAHRIETSHPREALVRTREGTVVADVSSPGRNGTLVAFDVGDTSWPLKTSFVLFVRNVVELAREHRSSGVTASVRTGTPLSMRVPPDVDRVTVERPDGQTVEVPARAGLAVVPDTTRTGFYHVSWRGARAGSTLVAANLTSDAESDVRPRRLEPGGAAVAETKATALEGHVEWSWVLCALALLLVLADVVWLTRRPRSRAVTLEAPRRPEHRDSRGVTA